MNPSGAVVLYLEDVAFNSHSVFMALR